MQYDDDGSRMKKLVAELVGKKRAANPSSSASASATTTGASASPAVRHGLLPSRPHSHPRQDPSTPSSSSTSTTIVRPPSQTTSHLHHLPPKPVQPSTSASSPVNHGGGGSTPSTSMIVGGAGGGGGSASPSRMGTMMERERKAHAMARTDAVEESLRAAREALFGSTAAGEQHQALEVVPTIQVTPPPPLPPPPSTSPPPPPGGGAKSKPRSGKQQGQQQRRMTFSWGTLSFGHPGGHARYAAPTRYAVEDEDDKVEEGGAGVDLKKEVGGRKMTMTREAKVERLGVLRELARNGMEYVVLDVEADTKKASTSTSTSTSESAGVRGGCLDVSDEEIIGFFLGFRIDKVYIYIIITWNDIRVFFFLVGGGRLTLGFFFCCFVLDFTRPDDVECEHHVSERDERRTGRTGSIDAADRFSSGQSEGGRARRCG